MNIINIIKLVEWKDIKKSLMYHYNYGCRNKNLLGYEKVFNIVKKYKKSKPEYPDEVIKISACYEEETNSWYDIYTNKYSLSFRSWKKLANIPISKETLDHYIYEDIIAHFLWEITYNGFTEEKMKKEREEVFGRIKDSKNDKNKKNKENKENKRNTKNKK